MRRCDKYAYTDKLLYDKLEMMRERPGMWMGAKSVTVLKTDLTGYLEGYEDAI